MNDLDKMLSEARREVDAAVDGVEPPLFRSPVPTVGRRVAVAMAAAAVLLMVIGGSTWWVRNQGGEPDVAATEPTVTSTSEVSPDSTFPPNGAAEARAVAELEERLRTVGLDLRTMASAPDPADLQALSSRYDSIAELAGTAEEEIRVRAAELANQLATVARLSDEVDAATSDLTAKRDSMAVKLQSLRTEEELAALTSELDAAEAQIVTIRLMRDELAALAAQLESAMSAVYVAIGPDAPVDEITVTHHDYGLRDLGLGANFADVASRDGDLWATTTLVTSPEEQREYGLVLRIDGASAAVEDTIELAQPMHLISTSDEVIWLARAGDGALPESAVATIDADTLDVEIADLNRLAVTAIAGNDEGLWIGAGNPTTVSYFDRTAREITRSIDLGGEGLVTSLALASEPIPVLWAALADGRVLRIDAVSGSELSVSDLGEIVFDLAVTGAIDPGGASPVWAVTATSAQLIDGEGRVVDSLTLDAAPCCTLPETGVSDSAWVLTRSGELRYVYPGANELVVAIEYPINDPGEGGGPQAITASGLSIWLAHGPWLTEVRFPQ